jgi:hypothetical protein
VPEPGLLRRHPCDGHPGRHRASTGSPPRRAVWTGSWRRRRSTWTS